MAKIRKNLDRRGSPIGKKNRFLYRGVHAGHPRIEDAKKGIVYPGDLSASTTAEEHNLGDVSQISPYTSWSFRLEVAQKNAYNYGAGGVVLRVRDDDPEPEDRWYWVVSPDYFGEEERLLFGVRIGIEVLEP